MLSEATTAAFQEAASSGSAFVPDAVGPDAVESILAELGDAPFESMPEEVGPVRQQTDSFGIRSGDWRRFPAARALRDELAAAARASGVRGLATWRPDEADAQRYGPGWSGISPHLDGKRFRRLVAVLTLSGSAPFTIHGTRDGPPLRQFEAAAGSLVLLRGPGLAGVRDGRPFHAVGAPRRSAPRMSIGLRMNASRRPGG